MKNETLDCVIKIDDEDKDLLIEHKWRISSYGYAVCVDYVCRINGKERRKNLRLNRVVAKRMFENIGRFYIDHINGDKLDNRRSNLRLCSHSQNLGNSKIHKNNTSGFKGVCWNKTYKKWYAYIRDNGNKKFIGSFETPEEAANAYDNAARKIFGEFARLNYPTENEQSCKKDG